MKTILHISVLELENLLCKKLVWLTAAGYVLAALTICLCDGLRQSYFYDVESLPIELTNFVEPYFLATALISALAPVFAGDREQNLDQLSAACLAGRKGRTAAKILASCVFAVTICGLFGAISVLIPAACGQWDGGLPVESIGGELGLSGRWTVSRYLLFSLASGSAGCVILSLLLLYISCAAASTATALSVSGTGILFEFLFHRFSFFTLLKEYNVWMFLKPYSFFCMNLLPFSPVVNLPVLCAAAAPVCGLAVWAVLRRGI